MDCLLRNAKKAVCTRRGVHRIAVLLTALAAGGIPCRVAAEPFTIAMIPDTQAYVHSSELAPLFTDQTEWIVANRAARNIRFATHVGDIVESGAASQAQWDRADASMSVLDGQVPYALALGNHDYDVTQTRGSATTYLSHFGPERFETPGYEWYRGHSPNGLSSYQVFQAGGREYLHLAAELAIDGESFDWASQVLRDHHTMPTIVSTHAYLRGNGGDGLGNPGGYLEAASAYGGNAPQAIWDNLIDPNAQVFMVVNGHYATTPSGDVDYAARNVRVNSDDRDVFEMFANYNYAVVGDSGDGFMRLIELDENTGKINVQTYSPTLDSYKTDDENEFSFDLDFDARFIDLPQPPEPPVVPEKTIYYIGGKPEDSDLVEHLGGAQGLTGLGHRVVYRASSAADYADAVGEGADLIVVSGTITSSTTDGKGFMASTIPILSFEPYSWDQYGWTGTVQNVDYGDSLGGKQNLRVEREHPLTAGFEAGSTVPVYQQADGTFSFGAPGVDADVLATMQNVDPGERGHDKATIFVYERGDALEHATGDDAAVTTAGARYIGFFVNEVGVADGVETIFGKLSPGGVALLDKAVAYGLAPRGPIAHWTFDADFDDSVDDIVGVPQGGASIVADAGVVGAGALELHRSSSQYVTVDGLAGRLATGDDATLSLWFSTTFTDHPDGNPTKHELFSAHKSATTNENVIRLGTTAEGGVFLNPTDIGGATHDKSGGSGYADGQWHLLVVTFNGDGQTTVYVDNGVVPGFSDVAGQPKWSDATVLSIGQEYDSGANPVAASGDYFDGLIDDVQLWDRLLGPEEIETLYRVVFPQPTVAGRHIFYNGSQFDGDDPLAGAADDAAIAVDKRALLPGNAATFENLTGFGRGINGIIIDMDHLARPGDLSAADFIFRVGNDDDPTGWMPAADPAGVTVREGEGEDGADRITIIWDDNEIEKQWLQVTVLANDTTGLEADDVFYWGNAIGETGDGDTRAQVNAADVIAARGNPHGPSNPAGVANRYDFNRDGAVDALDLILARANATSPLSALRLITVPGPSLHITAVPEPAGIWPALLGWLCLLMSRRRKR